MITGARQGRLSGLRRLIASSMARDLGAFVVPGLDIARAHGLDIEASGLHIVTSPRHASVLLVIGDIPPSLRDAASVVYAQMLRPRVLFVLGAESLSPLPAADVTAGLTQQELNDGVRQLRTVIAEGAFSTEITDFDAPALQSRIEYTCPMHPEIVRDEPGSCPICGMFLIERVAQATAEHTVTEHGEMSAAMETQSSSSHDHCHHKSEDAVGKYTCPMHPEVIQDKRGSCPKCGMDLVLSNAEPAHEHHHHEHDSKTHDTSVEYTCPMHPEIMQNEPGSCPKCGMDLVLSDAEPAHEHHHHEHHNKAHDTSVEYTCPMHPEIVQDEPGSCPKCGMNLVLQEEESKPDHASMGHGTMDHSDMNHSGMDHSAMGHDGMDHDDAGFMSMIDVTKDLPRSGDGLPMEWIVAPFGPFFPGLPSGLLLTLTLDGDTIADSDIRSLIENTELIQGTSIDSGSFVKRLGNFEPLTPVTYQLLACRALENAAGVEITTESTRARIGALERERITSHLGWLALFGQQTGFDWLMKRATSLQFKSQHADLNQIKALKPAIDALIKRLQRTPLLKARTVNIGRIAANSALCGPIARAAGMSDDTRSSDEAFTSLGFTAANRENGDVHARLHLRLDELVHSIMLTEAAGAIECPSLSNIGEASGSGVATVETPRGEASLKLTLEMGKVVAAQLETPSTRHFKLIKPLIDQQELGDALVAVGSLDLSPWEIRQ